MKLRAMMSCSLAVFELFAVSCGSEIITVSPSTFSLTVGQTVQLAAADRDQNGTAMTGVTNTWSSTNTAVATVSASGLVTAVAAGSATITATSSTVSGSAAITVSAVQPPPPSSGFNANEPAGFSMLTDRPFNTVATSCSDAVATEGWNTNEECQWHHISVVSDPTAPRSPNNVLQAWYPAGTQGGTTDATPGRLTKDFAAKNQVYVSMWVKLSSNFVGNGTNTNKVIYIWDNNKPAFFMSAEGGGMGNLIPTGRYQGPLDPREALPPNLVPPSSVALQRGVWQHWEIIVKANTPGVRNGEFHLWVNGQKVAAYTDVGFLGASETQPFMKMDVEPIWGGGGSTVPADQYMWFDHVYTSGK